MGQTQQKHRQERDLLYDVPPTYNGVGGSATPSGLHIFGKGRYFDGIISLKYPLPL